MTEIVKIKALADADMHPANAAMQFWWVVPYAGTKREDLLHPSFWRHVARKLKSPAIIHSMPQDGAWFARHLVLYADQNQAKVAELEFKQLENVSEIQTSDYVAGWIAPSVKFGVRRKSDNTIMKSGFPSLADAEKYMNESLLGRRAA